MSCKTKRNLLKNKNSIARNKHLKSGAISGPPKKYHSFPLLRGRRISLLSTKSRILLWRENGSKTGSELNFGSGSNEEVEVI
jgi:hypothetical protein